MQQTERLAQACEDGRREGWHRHVKAADRQTEVIMSKKEQVIVKLKANGCRITKQRLMLIDIILENECSSCKEIYYKAAKQDERIGVATVYRMINALEEVGAISRKNMYKVECSEDCVFENACKIVLDDKTSVKLSPGSLNKVIQEGLRHCGYVKDQKVTAIRVHPENEKTSSERI